MGDRYLRAAYAQIYTALGARLPDGVEGPVIEIGSGSGVGRAWIPGMVCTDVVPADRIDEVVDAGRLPYASGTVRAFVLKDALHHLPDAPAFLAEAARCLRPGGAVLLCEPYWGPLARLVYRFAHPEPFDTGQRDWILGSDSPWDSNQALAWILLRRDRARFAASLPEFRIGHETVVLGPSYLLSGGVFGRLPVPSGLLLPLLSWEGRRGAWLDPVRLEVMVTLHRVDSGPDGTAEGPDRIA